MSKTVQLPATIGQAKKRLGTLGALATATEWERAAIVYVFTEKGQHGGPGGGTRKAVPGLSLTIEEFAKIGLYGLRKRHTVARYHNTWARYGDPAIKPGDRITLPTIKWPPDKDEEAKKLPRRTKAEFERAPVETKAEIVAEALDDPEVMKEVHKIVAATPEGKEVRRRVKATSARGEEEGPRPVTTVELVGHILDGPIAGVRELAERCLDAGLADGKTRAIIAALVQHVRASADMMEAAADGTAALTDDELEQLLTGGE